MMETSAEFGDWLMLDIEVIERKVVEMFLSVADRTRIELEQFKNQAQPASLYYSGEIAGPGTLICNECGYRMQFVTTAQIETCPECGNNTFQRAEFKRNSE
jgi:anaerobic ribonucleoside-triphosphate reductase